METFNIKNFLEKFSLILVDKEDIINSIKDLISKEISFEIKNESIKIIKGVVYIKTTPIIKNEILMRKKIILDSLSTKIKNQKFIDIQ